MKSPGAFFLSIVAALPGLCVLWSQGGHTGFCWFLSGAALFNWLAFEALRNAQRDGPKEAVELWAGISGIFLWVFLVICLIAFCQVFGKP